MLSLFVMIVHLYNKLFSLLSIMLRKNVLH